MNFVSKKLLWASILFGGPLIALTLVYGFNSNMRDSDAVELYKQAEAACENPYASAAFARRTEEYEQQLELIEARAKRSDQIEFAARINDRIQYAELQIAAIVCERAVIDYFDEVTSRQANSFDQHWGWRAKFHAECRRKVQEMAANRFGDIRAPLSQAIVEEPSLDFGSVQRSVHRQIEPQPQRIRAHIRMCQ